MSEQKQLPIFGLGVEQRSPFVSTVERINAVVEMTENGRSQSAIYGLPGLTAILDFGIELIRDIYIREGDSIFYVVQADQFLSIAFDGSLTLLGTLGTLTGPAWISDNGQQLFINDGVSPSIYDPHDETFTAINSTFPKGATGATFHAGRFFVCVPTPNAPDPTIEGRVYASGLYDGLVWDALDFFTPESLPDGVVDIVRWQDNLIVFGQSSMEFWTNAQISVPGALGYQIIAGAATEVGLAAVKGWSAAGQQFFFLGRMKGQASVFELTGYRVAPVSTPKLDLIFAGLPTRSNAIATGYQVTGHSIFQITFPLIVDGQTWAYDTTTQLWCRRVSLGLPYYRGLLSVTSNDQVYITSAFVSKIFRMDSDVYTEDTFDMVFELSSIHLLKNGDTLSLDSIWLDMETGLAVAGENPQVMIQISKDGGHVWGEERFVSAGKTGEYKTRAIRRRMGLARDIAVRMRITDPVARRVTGAYMRVTGGVS